MNNPRRRETPGASAKPTPPPKFHLPCPVSPRPAISSSLETRMAISVVCECGKEFSVKDELAGKKIKGPACQSVLTVPEGGAASAGPPPARKPAPPEDDYDDAAAS